MTLLETSLEVRPAIPTRQAHPCGGAKRTLTSGAPGLTLRFTERAQSLLENRRASKGQNTSMNSKALILIVGTLAPAYTTAAPEAAKYIVAGRSADRSPLPFSEGVLVGNTLYVAGHIGIDPKTDQAAKDPEVEAKLVMDAVQRTVHSAGLTMDDLVSVTVYCTDLDRYDAFNKTYESYFHGRYPTRAFIGVARLLRGAHFEVQGIAVKLPVGTRAH